MKQAVLYKREGKGIRCLACNHKCLIQEGKTGICRVRKNMSGKLFLLTYGRIISESIDPIEKKPLYHFLQKTKTYSIAGIGCNFKCDWCQNFDISQNLSLLGEERTAEQIVRQALKSNCKSISYTYTEPTIFVEFVKEVSALAEKKALKNIWVTNGYLSDECFEYIKDYIDAANIDLKSFSDATYKKYCSAKLHPVLKNIKKFYNYGIHIEITTLIIPKINDSQEELRKIAEFISSIDKKIPWHISRFFPMHRMLGKGVTPIDTLKKAEAIGRKAGLKYVHIGNV